MKFAAGHAIAAADIAAVFFLLVAFAAWLAAAALTYRALRRSDESTTLGALWGGGVVLGGALLLVFTVGRDAAAPDAERRAIEARATEMMVRAVSPGSPLACLDAVSSAPVEMNCEKALFASAETVAAALAYVNAQVALLASGEALAASDPSYQPSAERLRRALEQDSFGLVAQVLATRGCNTPDCADLALLRDRGRVVANMKKNVFASRVQAYAATWAGSGTPSGPAASPLPATAAVTDSTGFASAQPAPAPGAPHRQYDYPSADSIPPVSIIEPETDGPLVPRKPQPQPRVRPLRQAPPAPAHAATPAPPMAIVPQESAQTSGQR